MGKQSRNNRCIECRIRVSKEAVRCRKCAGPARMRDCSRCSRRGCWHKGDVCAQCARLDKGDKYCRICQTVRPLSGFSKACGGDGYTSRCKTCTSADRKADAGIKSRRPRHNRKSALWRRYRMTIEEWEVLFHKQGGLCAVCGVEEQAWKDDSSCRRLCVDHCHKSGRIRGLVCGPCNRSLGMMEDCPERFRKAATYLEGFRDTCTVR